MAFPIDFAGRPYYTHTTRVSVWSIVCNELREL